MKKNKLLASRFLSWYFSDIDIMYDIGKDVLSGLYDKGEATITLQALLDSCGYIPSFICVDNVEEDCDYDTNEVELVNDAKVIDLPDYKSKYEALLEELKQYKNESVKWSVDDFMFYEHQDYTITMEQAQKALEDMIRKHDPEYGITWLTIEAYIEDFGTKKYAIFDQSQINHKSK